MNRTLLAMLVLVSLVLAACSGGSTADTSEATTAALDTSAETELDEADDVICEAGDHTLTVAVYPGALLSLPEYVGVAEGTYEEHGVAVELIPIPTGPDQIAAMASGSVDISGNTAGNLLLANAQGQDLVILGNNFNVPLYTWLKQPDFEMPDLDAEYPQNVEGFRDARIGISARGSEVELFTRVLLNDAGIDPDAEVSWVAVGFGQTAISAFESDQVDILITIEPVQTILLERGSAETIIDLRSGQEGPEMFREFPGQSRTSTRATSEEKSEAIICYLEAQAEVLEFIKDESNTERIAEIYAPEAGQDVDIAAALVENNRHAYGLEFDCSAYENVLEYLSVSGQFDEQALANAQSCDELVWANAPMADG